MKRIADCRLLPHKVGQMQEGDMRSVDLWALWADGKGRPFLSANAPVREAEPGRLIVSVKDGAYRVDMSGVPNYRWPRYIVAPVMSVPVADVAGTTCP